MGGGRLIEMTLEWQKVSLLGREAEKRETQGEKKKKIPVHLILMRADASVKNKRPWGREEKFESKTQIESDRT